MAYDANKDYAALMSEAAARGDYRAAAQYEQQRNEKIAGTGSNYQQTNLYSQYLNGGSSGNSGGATQTSYIDANGDKQTGYIINGSTFTDAGGTTPIGAGSIVDTSNGRYIKTPTGSMLYSDYLKNNGITPTSYLDANDAARTGYIKDGVTYSDVLATTPVGVGSIVNTGNGQYIKTDNGSMLYTDYLNQLQAQQQARQTAQMQQLQNQLAQVETLLAQAQSSNNTTYAAQLEQARLQIQQQIAALNRSYQDLNRQLYVDYMNARKNLPQALAAQGYTGGLTESGMIGLETGYQGQLAANERERLTGIRDLEAGGLNAELELRIAQTQANQQAADTAYDRQAQVYAAMLQQMNRDEDRAADAEDREYTRALERGRLLGQLTGDYSPLYSALGYTPAAPVAAYSGGYTPTDPGVGNSEKQKLALDTINSFGGLDIPESAVQALINAGATESDFAQATAAAEASGTLTAAQVSKIADMYYLLTR